MMLAEEATSNHLWLPCSQCCHESPSLSCLHSASITNVQQRRHGPAARRQLFSFSADARSGWPKVLGPPARQLPTGGFNSESSSFPFPS